MDAQRALWESVQEAMLTLGEPTMQSMIWHMDRAGVPMAPETFSIMKFSVALHDMINGGADVILDIAARNMAAKLVIDVQVDPRATAMDRIYKILEMAKQVER